MYLLEEDLGGVSTGSTDKSTPELFFLEETFRGSFADLTVALTTDKVPRGRD